MEDCLRQINIMNPKHLGILFTSSLAFLYCNSNHLAQAQIVPDSTLPASSTVNINNKTLEITGGTQVGSNLFHSFQDFSVPLNTEAYFNNPLAVENIFSRVTGRNISNINGLIRANGTANLFLLNPNGIIFGPNAALNIGGSFMASTADRLVFDDGSSFSARNPETPPLLNVNVPIGLQFGPNPGNIINQSVATVNEQTVGLQVQPGKTLALIGGNINLDGGFLTAHQGKIELGSGGANSFVDVIFSQNFQDFNYNNVQNFQDIQLLKQAKVNASGEGGGNIQIRGKEVTLTDGSAIISDTFGSQNGADILIEADRFLVQNGAFVSSSTFGTGAAGNLTVRAVDSVHLIGSGNFDDITIALIDGKFDLSYIHDGLFTTSFGLGNSGQINLETQNLTVENGALLLSTTFVQGQGADINLRAGETINVIDAGVITGSASPKAAGNLTINTQRLNIQKGGGISTASVEEGDSGDLTVNVSEVIEMFGSTLKLFFPEKVKTVFDIGGSTLSVDAYGSGVAGNLTITTKRLILWDGSGIYASAGINGKAGVITIFALEKIELTPSLGYENSVTSLSSYTDSNRQAGDIFIETKQLIARNGGQIQAATFGVGAGGNISIKASDFIELIGQSTQGGSSGILASSQQLENVGDAGNIKIETGRLIVRDGAIISVSGREFGQAGNLEIIADSIYLDGGDIRGTTGAGGSGNITIRSDNIQLRGGSTITTSSSSQNGGNIQIQTNTLTALENSDISANAQQGRGGQVRINAAGIFGTKFRSEPTSLSDITATSDLGAEFNGIVELNLSEVNLNTGLFNISEDFVDAENLIVQGCEPNQNNSRFVNTGTGGMPPNPNEILANQAFWEDLRPLMPGEKASSVNIFDQISARVPVILAEAQGWVKNPDGTIILTTTPPVSTSHESWQRTFGCEGKPL
jgi:filamentous hemagglutinin family protein